MTYQDQIKSPKWQKKRLEVLELHKFECQGCGDKESTLHVHHPYYEKGKKIWEYKAEDLMCLCEQCHSNSHARQDRILFLIGWLENFKSQTKDQILGYLEGLMCLPQKNERSEHFMRGYIDACHNLLLKPHFDMVSRRNESFNIGEE